MQSERYLRHSMIDWFDQEKLDQLSVVVVGAGAVGNEVLKCLCLLGIGRIHIIDFDGVEVHNLSRTVLFDDSHVGRNKAQAAAEACRRINPHVEITFDTNDFWSSLSIENLKSYDSAFCCVDNFEARMKLNKLCLIARVDYYNAGIDSRALTVEQYTFSVQDEVACYECGLPPSVYTRIGERYSCGWLRKKAFEQKKVPTTIITSSIAGALISSLLLQGNHADGYSGSIRCFVDTIRLTSTVTSLQRNEDCVTCGTIRRANHYLKVKNLVKTEFATRGSNLGDTTVNFSDQLILEVSCKLCGSKSVVNDRAERYDESLIICETCNLKSNDISFADSMTLSELIERFSLKSLPVKFVYFYAGQDQFILELEA